MEECSQDEKLDIEEFFSQYECNDKPYHDNNNIIEKF